MSTATFHEKRKPPSRTPVRIGPPATARDALRRLEAVRTFDELVYWCHELRASGLLGPDGVTEEVRYWGTLWPGERPPQSVSVRTGIRLPAGEVVRYVGDWEHGQWQRLGAAWEGR